MNLDFLGLLAGIITPLAQVPQIIQSIRTKKTYDVSLGLYLILFVGIFFWVLYGYFKPEPVVFYMNILLLSFISTMIFLKLKYGVHTVNSKD